MLIIRNTISNIVLTFHSPIPFFIIKIRDPCHLTSKCAFKLHICPQTPSQIFKSFHSLLPALLDLYLRLAASKSSLLNAGFSGASPDRHLASALHLEASSPHLHFCAPYHAIFLSARAVRYLGAGNFAAAGSAALEALELRLGTFGGHNRTLQSLALLAEVVAAWTEFPRRRSSVRAVVRAALVLAKGLRANDREVDESSLRRLEKSQEICDFEFTATFEVRARLFLMKTSSFEGSHSKIHIIVTIVFLKRRTTSCNAFRRHEEPCLLSLFKSLILIFNFSL